MKARKLLAMILASAQIMGTGMVSAVYAVGESQTEVKTLFEEVSFVDEDGCFGQATQETEPGSVNILLSDSNNGSGSKAVPRTTEEITEIVESYLSQCEGRYWNANIREGNISAKSTKKLMEMVEKGDLLGATTDKPCNVSSWNTHLNEYGCKSNIFTGVSKGAAQCWGFADYMEYVIFRTVSGNDFDKTLGKPNFQYDYLPGDIIGYIPPQGTWHVFVIYKVERDNVYIVEANNEGYCLIGRRNLYRRQRSYILSVQRRTAVVESKGILQKTWRVSDDRDLER